MREGRRVLPVVALVLGCACLPHRSACFAQEMQLGDLGQAKPAPVQRVSFDPEPLTIAAGKPTWIELRFHVAPGFHINDHTPADELLTPTTLQLPGTSQLRLLGESYPKGTPLRLNIGTGELLSSYTGVFRLRLQILAKAGDSSLEGTLHYQACSTVSCLPPRDLPISVPLHAR